MTEQNSTSFENSAGSEHGTDRAYVNLLKGNACRERLTKSGVSSHDLAWAAGMIDGEGSISVVRQKYGPDEKGNKRASTIRLKLAVVQNDWSTLNRLKTIIDGKGYLSEVPWHESHNRRVYQLQYDGVNALRAINKLAPFIYRKKHYVHCANKLWTEGAMGSRPGRKGLSPEVISAREKWVSRFRRLS